MTTIVRLCGDEQSIKDVQLAMQFADWEVFKEGETYFLKTETLDENQTIREVGAAITQFLEVLNGMVSCMIFEHEKVTWDSLSRRKKEGSNHYVMLADGIVLTDRISVAPAILAAKFQKLVTLSKTEINVRHALYDFREINWINLYRIFEIIRKDLGGQANIDASLHSQIALFRRSAQLHRHSPIEFEHTKKPMSLLAGYRFIKTLFEYWIDSK